MICEFIRLGDVLERSIKVVDVRAGIAGKVDRGAVVRRCRRMSRYASRRLSRSTLLEEDSRQSSFQRGYRDISDGFHLYVISPKWIERSGTRAGSKLVR